jgi:hypothetical protein
MASSHAGVQMQVHTKFIEWKKRLKNERIKIGKEGSGELSDKRLSLTLVKYFTNNQEAYNTILNANINLKEE